MPAATAVCFVAAFSVISTMRSPASRSATVARGAGRMPQKPCHPGGLPIDDGHRGCRRSSDGTVESPPKGDMAPVRSVTSLLTAWSSGSVVGQPWSTYWSCVPTFSTPSHETVLDRSAPATPRGWSSATTSNDRTHPGYPCWGPGWPPCPDERTPSCCCGPDLPSHHPAASLAPPPVPRPASRSRGHRRARTRGWRCSDALLVLRWQIPHWCRSSGCWQSRPRHLG